MKDIQQQQARNLFITTTQTQQQIADTVGVDKKTLYRWIKQECWDQVKQATLAMPSLIVHNLFSQVAELQQHIASREDGMRFPTMHEAEVIRKLINTAQKLGMANSVSTNIEVMMSFSDYTLKQDLNFTKQLVKYADQYFSDYIKKPQNEFPHNFFLADKQPLQNTNAGNPITEDPIVDEKQEEASTEPQPMAQEKVQQKEGILPPPSPETIASSATQEPAADERKCPPKGITGHSVQTIPTLPGGVTYIGNNLVFVPNTRLKRSIHITELEQYKKLGFTLPQLNDIINKNKGNNKE